MEKNTTEPTYPPMEQTPKPESWEYVIKVRCKSNDNAVNYLKSIGFFNIRWFEKTGWVCAENHQPRIYFDPDIEWIADAGSAWPETIERIEREMCFECKKYRRLRRIDSRMCYACLLAFLGAYAETDKEMERTRMDFEVGRKVGDNDSTTKKVMEKIDPWSNF